jgi:hypothetical protein
VAREARGAALRPGRAGRRPARPALDAVGELGVLDLRVRHGVVRSAGFPDALARVWDATECEPAGEVLLTAAEGV